MSNPFDSKNLVPNWNRASEILKGDVSGHPFHGNQWKSAVEMSQFVATNAKNGTKYGTSTGFVKPLAIGHRIAAEQIEDAVHGHSSEMTNGDRLRATRAIQAHLDAAQAHEAVMEHIKDSGRLEASFDKDPVAQDLAQKASDASANAMTATNVLANTHAE